MELKRYRKARGLTQEEAAAAIGIPTKTYQNYEREVREADSEVLCALADLYDVSLDELVGRAAPVAEPERWGELLDRDEKALIDAYRSMGADGRRALVAIAETLAGVFPGGD